MELGQFCRLNRNATVNVWKYPQRFPITGSYIKIPKGTDVAVVGKVSSMVVIVTDYTYRYDVLIKHLDEVEITNGKLLKINKSKKAYKSIW